MVHKDNEKIRDITDQVYDISGQNDDSIFVDLSGTDQEIESQTDEQKVKLPSDNSLLYDFSREIFTAQTLKDLYNILIFSIMGQLGCSSASIIQPSQASEGRWILAEHHGSRLRNRNITFRETRAIFQKIINSTLAVDLVEYENSSEDTEEYQKFFSLGARVAIALHHEGKAAFILLLGQKIELQEYSKQDFRLIQMIMEMTSLVFSRIEEIDSLKAELSSLKVLEERLDRIDRYEFDVRSGGDEEINSIIQTEMKTVKVNSYAFLLYNDVTNRYEVQFCDRNDSLDLKKNKFSISSNNAMIAYCKSLSDYTVVENPVSSEVLARVFPQDFLIRVNIFSILPYSIQGHLTGILFILRIDSDYLAENIPQIKRFSRFVFAQLYTRNHLNFLQGHVDTLQPLFSRLEHEYEGCRLLGIPLTCALFHISGFSRVVGKISLEKLQELQEFFSQVLKKNSTETDFSFRVSFNEFCIAYPGKEKKQVLRAASSVKNKIENLSSEFSVSYKIFTYPDVKKPLVHLFETIE